MGSQNPHMGNLPVVHEVCTSVGSLGDAIVGRPDKARQRWNLYSEESFFGSGIYAAVEASKGRKERARELGRGMGRATGKIICGGGVLRELPVLHELATCGESLGDMIGGMDRDSAEARWNKYAESSVFGSSIYAAVEAGKGNEENARVLLHGCGRAATKGAITVGAVAVTAGVTLLTAGAGTPAAVTAASCTGASTGAAATAGVQAVDGKVDPGDVVASALLGGAAGAVGGKLAGNAKGVKLSGASDTILAARCIGTATPAGMASVLTEVRQRIRAQRLRTSRSDLCLYDEAVNKTNAVELQEVISQEELQEVISQEESELVECPICLDIGCTQNPLIPAQMHTCIHHFHASCLNEWKMACASQSIAFTCPQCRVNLEE